MVNYFTTLMFLQTKRQPGRQLNKFIKPEMAKHYKDETFLPPSY